MRSIWRFIKKWAVWIIVIIVGGVILYNFSSEENKAKYRAMLANVPILKNFIS